MPEPEISPEVMARIVGQDWPGNARALMNAAMRFALGLGEAVDDGGAETGLADQLAQVERTLLQDALRRHSGNATQAATGLKLPRKTFYDKLARYGIKPEDFR
ncbi:MAG: helix-turn-helix domain-containing protein [Paracoccaceae bacterium]